MSKAIGKYQISNRDQPCSFKGVRSLGDCFGQVTGHHIKIVGLKSLNSKTSDGLTIPVCITHHAKCESNEISKDWQLHIWTMYMLERLTQKYGQTKAVEMLAAAYWEMIE